MVICHSCDPYPIWIWLPDDATEEEKEFVYETVKETFGFNGKYRFNSKYTFAEYMIKRADQENQKLKIVTNLLAYHCPSPIPPRKTPKGSFYVATADDLDIAVSFIKQFHEDINMDKSDAEKYRAKANVLISEKKLFFWTDEAGDKVAMCSYHVSADKGSLGNVFTKHDKRRQGYAAKLVYEVSKLILKQGKIPTLYTDADYAASNACYQTIGYKIKGNLCTLA